MPFLVKCGAVVSNGQNAVAEHVMLPGDAGKAPERGHYLRKTLLAF
jgi:hypothetical protein